MLLMAAIAVVVIAARGLRKVTNCLYSDDCPRPLKQHPPIDFKLAPGKSYSARKVDEPLAAAATHIVTTTSISHAAEARSIVGFTVGSGLSSYFVAIVTANYSDPVAKLEAKFGVTDVVAYYYFVVNSADRNDCLIVGNCKDR